VVDIGKVDFYGWQVYGFNAVVNSDTSVGKGSWIDDHAVSPFKIILNIIDDLTFVITPEKTCLPLLICNPLIDNRMEFSE